MYNELNMDLFIFLPKSSDLLKFSEKQIHCVNGLLMRNLLFNSTDLILIYLWNKMHRLVFHLPFELKHIDIFSGQLVAGHFLPLVSSFSGFLSSNSSVKTIK